MTHPDPNAPPDRTPIQIGEVWENPMTGERATILELPQQNPSAAWSPNYSRLSARG
jgi:hypothetical protein